MKAEQLARLLTHREAADMYVNIEGTHIPVVSARYDPADDDQPPQVIVGLDRLQVLLLLEKLKNGAERQ